MFSIRCLVCAGCSLFFAITADSFAAEYEVFGPIFSQFSATLGTGERTEIAGPLLRFELEESEERWALSPLLFHSEDSLADSEEFDLLYPIVTYDRFGAEKRFQILQLFNVSGSQTLDGKTDKRFTLFPLYFQQRSTDPTRNYTALLPLYGNLKNRLGRDEMHFVLFPLYLQSRKGDVITDNYLFPFFHARHGNELAGWQFWPFVGKERKGLTSRTNVLEEVEVVAGHDKLFVLWPFYFRNRLGLGTTNVQTQDLLLPFYSIQHSPMRESTSYLWPLGFTKTIDRGKKYQEWGAPWPLIVFARGEGKTANRVWPLFGQAKNPVLQSDFYLWPIYKYNRATSEPLDRERTRILFFLYSDVKERNTQAGTELRRTDLWPFFTSRRDHSGNQRLQILAPLEPILPNNKSVERNYSPLWSVWRSERNAKTGASSQSLFWNLYRSDRTPVTKKCSLLFGLFRYQSDADGRRWRLFYLPVGRQRPATATPP